MSKDLIIAGRKFSSRLMLGTGKFSSNQIMADAIHKSETEIVTVALRRVDFDNHQDDILSYIDREKILLLPNTSGAIDHIEAVRLARLARSAGLEPWVKLEVTPNPYHLLPDAIETLKAAEILVKDGFIVLPYIQADPILARRLEDLGVATVMPLAAPIGTNKGIRAVDEILMIIEQSSIPVVIDAGIGAPSHAAAAIELGADAVLVNTAIAVSDNPAEMAAAFAMAVKAAYIAREAGIAPINNTAVSSSPLTGFLKDI